MKVIKNQNHLTASSRFSKIANFLPILLILSLATILYFYQINRESLWIDEIFSIAHSQIIINNFTLNRPLYLILLNVWMHFGDNEAWLRSLSAIFGLISVWLIYQLGIRLFSRETGLIAALLLTLSPLVINHAQEVRFYLLSMCLGLGGSLVLTDILEKFTISSLVKWLSLRFLAVLTTPINVLLFLPDAVLLGIRFHSQKKYLVKIFKKWQWLIITFTVLLLMALVDIVPPLLDFLEGQQQLIPPPGFPAFVGALTRFTIWPLVSPFAGLESIYENLFNVYAIIFLALLGLALYITKTTRLVKLWWSAAWSFLPLGVLFILCQTYSKLWGIDRYLLFTAPYILILLAAGWLKLWQGQKVIAIAVAVFYGIVVGGALFNFYTVQYREDWRGVTQQIIANENLGDRILVFPQNYLPAIEHYYQGTASIQGIQKPIPFERSRLKQAISLLSSDSSQFWLVCRFHNFSIYSQQKKLLTNIIQEEFYILKHQQFAGDVELFLVSARQ